MTLLEDLEVVRRYVAQYPCANTNTYRGTCLDRHIAPKCQRCKIIARIDRRIVAVRSGI